MKAKILEIIEGRKSELQKALDRARERMQADFKHFFCYESENTYRSFYIFERIEQLQKDVEETQSAEELTNLLKHGADFYLCKLTDSELFASTSIHMVNVSRNLEMEAAQILYRLYIHLHQNALKYSLS